MIPNAPALLNEPLNGVATLILGANEPVPRIVVDGNLNPSTVVSGFTSLEPLNVPDIDCFIISLQVNALDPAKGWCDIMTLTISCNVREFVDIIGIEMLDKETLLLKAFRLNIFLLNIMRHPYKL